MFRQGPLEPLFKQSIKPRYLLSDGVFFYEKVLLNLAVTGGVSLCDKIRYEETQRRTKVTDILDLAS